MAADKPGSGSYLENPSRERSIIHFRQQVKNARFFPTPATVRNFNVVPYQIFNDMHDVYSQIPKLFEMGDLSTREYKGVSAFEMSRKPDEMHVAVFKLTIMETRCFESAVCVGEFAAPVKFLCETEDGSVCTLEVLGIHPDDKTFEIGRMLAVVAPTVVTSLNTNPINSLCTDEMVKKYLFPLGRKHSICRYCCKENAQLRCSECQAPYCNEKCKHLDRNVLEHKLVCSTLVWQEFDRQNTSVDGNTLCDVNSRNPIFGSKRISTIVNHRRKYDFIYAKVLLERRLFYHPFDEASFAPHHVKCRKLSTIALKDMVYEQDYTNSCIKLQIIEEPMHFHIRTTHLLVEDVNKDVTLLAINGLSQNERLYHQLVFGASILVFHPFYKVGVGDGEPMIRVDHLDSVLIVGKNLLTCNFCGNGSAKLHCENKCGKMYCDEKCREHDNTILEHKRMCVIYTMSMVNIDGLHL